MSIIAVLTCMDPQRDDYINSQDYSRLKQQDEEDMKKEA